MAFLSKKKKLKKLQAQDQTVDPALVEQIHVMPQRFYVKTKKQRFGVILVVVLGILIIGGLAGFAYYLNQNLAPLSPQPVSNQSPTADTTTPPLAPVVTAPATSTSSTNTSVSIDLNQPTTTPTTTPGTTSPGGSIDLDGDQLTSVEESLYGTNPTRADTDGDTFLDGPELLNGFSPLGAGQRIGDTSLFTSYGHPDYSIIYPSAWQVQERDAEKREVLFVSDLGEFVEVLVIPNINNLPLDEWFSQTLPGVSFADATLVTINNTTGIRHPDGLSYYLVSPNNVSTIYFILYNNAGAVDEHFLTTFNVMVKNFFLTP